MDILVVDDNIVNRKLLKTYAKNIEGVEEIYEADDGDIGLQKFYEHQDTIGLILLDIYMPKMTGFEVLEELQKKEVSVPIIVLSTDDTQEDVIKQYGVHFVNKPVKQNELLQKIENII